MIRTLRLVVLPVLTICYGLMIPTALACGGFFCQQPNAPILQTGEAIVFAVDEEANTVTMHVQIMYEGPAEGFSWILPVPSTPTISVGTDLLFRGLFQTTLPTFQLDIVEEASESCSLDKAVPLPCPFVNSFGLGVDPSDGNKAAVVEQGSVGPFTFVILEPAEKDPSSILRWLVDNGYDQPKGADDLLNYYAIQGMQFVALRLQKDTEIGEIEPIVLTYNLPESDGTDTTTVATATETAAQTSRRTALAGVPIQLTRIAAVDNMEVQVYILGDARAVPLNYLEVKLDDTQVNWVGCIANPACYDEDYRQRYQTVTETIGNHTFITEYAGSTDILDKVITLNQVSMHDLMRAKDPLEFLTILSEDSVPDTRRVTSLVNQYIPPIFPETAPSFCQELNSAYQGPSQHFGIVSAECLWGYKPTPDWTWDAKGLALVLEENIFSPANQAQEMVDRYPYLTRLYTSLSPDQMIKDPFFAFKPELRTVSHIHKAVAVPECIIDGSAVALDITVEGTANSVSVPATIDCDGWGLAEPIPLAPSVSPASQVSAWGFANDKGILIQRFGNGTFDQEALQAAIAFGDSLVMDQTIPEYPALVTDDEDDKNVEITVNDTALVERDTDDDGTQDEKESTQNGVDSAGAPVDDEKETVQDVADDTTVPARPPPPPPLPLPPIPKDTRSAGTKSLLASTLAACVVTSLVVSFLG